MVSSLARATSKRREKRADGVRKDAVRDDRTMRAGILLPLVLLASCGCANQQLRYSTARQVSTHGDLQQDQVMENFARLAADRGAVPFYALANQATTTISDSAASSVKFFGIPRAYTSGTFGPYSASRSISVNWSLAPLNNPDRIQAMRAAYLTVLDPMAVNDAEYQKLQAIIGKDQSYVVETGWICTGRKREVPKHAAWVAHCGRVYVWLMPENTEQLGRFRLLLLNIATYSPAVPTAGGGERPEAAPSPLESATPATTSPFQPRLFDEPPGVNPGYFFIPRL
jgi:hypothetical protein